MKEKKKLLNVDLFVMVLPMIFGFFLPETFQQNKLFLWTWQFLFPLSMIAAYLLIEGRCRKEKENCDNQKILEKFLALMPAILLGIEAALAFSLMKEQLSVFRIAMAICGFTFIYFGNLLPKLEQNQTIGVRTPWTLKNRDNWNYTNRQCGKAWFLFGLVLLFIQFLPNGNLTLPLSIFLITLIGLYPIWISWRYAQTQKREHTWHEENRSYSSKLTKLSFIVTTSLIGLLVIGVLALGKFSVTLSSDSMEIHAVLESDTKISFSEVDEISLIKTPNGKKVFGYDSFFLCMGKFYAPELGNYRCYIWSFSPNSIAIRYQETLLILNEKSESKTRELYDQIVLEVQKTKSKSTFLFIPQF